MYANARVGGRQSLSTRSIAATLVQQTPGLHIHAFNKPPIPKAGADSAALLLKTDLQSPLSKAAPCQGCPGALAVAVSLHAQTLTAVMGRRSAPTPRQGNWLEMMGHKHTSQGRRGAKQTAN